MKGFKKGISGNPKGKPIGATTKVTKQARELFVSILENEVVYIQQALKDVREKDSVKYLEIFAKYAQYFIPKKVENNIISEEPLFEIITADFGISDKAISISKNDCDE